MTTLTTNDEFFSGIEVYIYDEDKVLVKHCTSLKQAAFFMGMKATTLKNRVDNNKFYKRGTTDKLYELKSKPYKKEQNKLKN